VCWIIWRVNFARKNPGPVHSNSDRGLTSSMDEFELIEHAFRKRAPFVHALTRLPNGDDASIHTVPEGQELVISTDVSVAGKHWPEDFPLSDAACRAVNAAVSDLAAMGAVPAWVWLGIMATSSDDADRMGQGVAMALKSVSMELAGGDTVKSSVNALSVTVAGMLPQGSGMRRDTAHAGQDVWLCGHAGFSAYGLRQWRQGNREGSHVPYFRMVRPLLQEGTRLRELGVTCCIDVSDGLSADAGHVADTSGVAVHLCMEKVDDFVSLAREMDEQEAIRLVLGGGEDYSLLFTASAEQRESLETFACRIGACREGCGVHTTLHGQNIDMAHMGYDHFA